MSNNKRKPKAKESIGQRIRRARHAAGLTQVQAVARLSKIRGRDVPQTAWSKYERQSEMKLGTLREIAQALNLTAAELLANGD
jgi:transcriptional regulator with XRE-family HTH domain